MKRKFWSCGDILDIDNHNIQKYFISRNIKVLYFLTYIIGQMSGTDLLTKIKPFANSSWLKYNWGFIEMRNFAF